MLFHPGGSLDGTYGSRATRRATAPADAEQHDCTPQIRDPDAESVAALLISERSWVSSTQAHAQLSVAAGADHRPKRFAERRDGVPCEQANCGYRYAAVTLSPTREVVERVARRYAEEARGRVIRYLVNLKFNKAVNVDCTELAHLDERALRYNEPRAIVHLRALRDAGADVLWVRGIHASRVAVIFVESVGSTIEVLDEAPHALALDGTWTRLAARPQVAGSPSRVRRSPQRPRVPHWSRLRGALFLAWQVLIALACYTLAPPLVEALGVEVSMPIWSVLLISMPLAWLIAQVVHKRLSPTIRQLREIFGVFSRLPLMESKWDAESNFLRRVTLELLDRPYLDGEHDDLDGEDGDDGDDDSDLQPTG